MAFHVDLDKAQRLNKTKLIKTVKMRTTTTLSKDGVETVTHDIEVGIYSALDALDKIARYHKLFTERQEIEATVKHSGFDVIVGQVYGDGDGSDTAG